MADAEHGDEHGEGGGGGFPSTPGQFALAFIGAFIGLFFIWLYTGGPERAAQEANKPFVSIPGTSGTSNNGGDGSTVGTPLPYDEVFGFRTSSSGAQATDPNKEFVVLQLERNAAPVTITGWKLRSLQSGETATIGQGTTLPGVGNTVTGPIVLRPGDSVYVTTGRSPIGFSFRTNMCTGYFDQYQEYAPGLSHQCPSAREELAFSSANPDDFRKACSNFLNGLGQCKMPGNPPFESDPQCVAFLTENMHYSGCVRNHKNDTDFVGKEWRVYLGGQKELWRSEREVIELIDPKGNVIDRLTY